MGDPPREEKEGRRGLSLNLGAQVGCRGKQATPDTVRHGPGCKQPAERTGTGAGCATRVRGALARRPPLASWAKRGKQVTTDYLWQNRRTPDTGERNDLSGWPPAGLDDGELRSYQGGAWLGAALGGGMEGCWRCSTVEMRALTAAGPAQPRLHSCPVLLSVSLLPGACLCRPCPAGTGSATPAPRPSTGAPRSARSGWW